MKLSFMENETVIACNFLQFAQGLESRVKHWKKRYVSHGSHNRNHSQQAVVPGEKGGQVTKALPGCQGDVDTDTNCWV